MIKIDGIYKKTRGTLNKLKVQKSIRQGAIILIALNILAWAIGFYFVFKPENTLAAQSTKHTTAYTLTTGFNGNFTNPTNAYTSNNIYATATDSKPRNKEFATNFRGFDFSAIPDGSTINSVNVYIEERMSAANTVGQWRSSVWADVTTSAALAPGALGAIGPDLQYTRASTDTVDTYWNYSCTGTLPTLAQLKGANFGIRVQYAQGNNGTVYTAYIDDIYIVVDYTGLAPGISASTGPDGKNSDSWFGEIEIYGTPTGGLNPGDYPQGSVRAKIVTPSITGYNSSTKYKDMTWSSANSRWEVTYKIDTDGYGPGLADPRIGTYNVTVQLDSESPYFSTGDGDAEYTSNTFFTTMIVRRRPAVNATSPQNYTDFIPTWSTDHWNYSINEFAIEATAANTNTIIKYPVYPTTANISNVSVTGTTVGLADGYASYWDSGSHSIVFKIDVISGQRLVNITFDSSTDLFGTRIDRYQTKDIGQRDFCNGLTISNSKMTIGVIGGDHEGAGEYIDLHAKNSTEETTVDCMERVALHINDTVAVDSAGYYNANVKWKQTDWMNWITSQDDSQIVFENEEDDTASSGWVRKLNNSIDAHRRVTFYASQKYIKNEYTFTNNHATNSYKFSMVWGREQWIEGSGGGLREANDKGMIPNNTTDYTYVNYDGSSESTITGSSLDKPWFATYDTGSLYSAGEIFQGGNRPDNIWFHLGMAYGTGYQNYIPISNASPYAVWPITTDPAGTGTITESHFFEKSWNSVAPTEAVSYTFWHYGTYDTSRANIVTQYNNDCDSLNPSLSLSIDKVYDIDGTSEDASMEFGNCDVNTSYIVGESLTNPEGGVKVTVSSPSQNYDLTVKADNANFSNGGKTIPVSRLEHAIHALSHTEGDWIDFSVSDYYLESSHSPGTNTFNYDYRLILTWDDEASSGYNNNFTYTITTTS